jgi:cytochrome c biogenesis protein CcmG/thiol:disulfide interchange protein DsbE
MPRFASIFVFLIVFNSLNAAKVHDFRLKNTENERVAYSDLKGAKVTVLDFWATWCKPCVRTIPKLVDLYEQFSDQGVQFIGINVDSPRNTQKVKPFSKSLGISYPVLLDINSEVMSQMSVTLLPTLFLVDENDEIVLMHQGYRPGDEKIIAQEIKNILENNERYKK